MESVAVIVMTKYPSPGAVKTRLTPALSPQQAADVHRLFLLHWVKRLHDLSPAELVICHDPPSAGMPMRDLVSSTTDSDATYLAQSPGDLGQRLAAAAGEVGRVHRRLLFVGVDAPDVPNRSIVRAARLTHEAAVSIGPTTDGGYWCLGLWNEVDAGALLAGIDWSSGREARQTLEHAESLGYAAVSGDPWEDVDRPDDLARLRQRLAGSKDPADRELLRGLDAIISG